MPKSADELRVEFGYWGDHPEHSVTEWQREVEEGNTRYGYWEWVATLVDCENEFTAITDTMES